MDYLNKRGKELETNYKKEVYGKKPATLNSIPDSYAPVEKFVKGK